MPASQKSFLEFSQAENLRGKALGKQIIQLLTQWEFELDKLSEKATMVWLISGKINGGQDMISRRYILMVYVH